MNRDRYRQVMQVVDAALECDPARREAVVNQACGEDDELMRHVMDLLAQHTAAGSFLNESPFEISTGLDDEGSIIGEHIGPYRVTEEIGRGGMGAVYKAVRDDEYRTTVAVKLIKRGMDSEAILRRFRQERQILANLNHPNIARLLDGGTTGTGLPFFVMEFIEGLPITEYADAHRLTTDERLELFRAACGAVTYAHTNLIVHRDLKPTNILVTPGGVPKLLDFGIAKILRTDFSPQATELTATELRVMTPEYASPEQVRGQSITTASDVYSLGVLLYELLTGRRPYHFDSRRPDEVARVICEREPARPSTVVGRFVETTPERGVPDSTAERLSLVRDGSPEKLQRRLRGDLDRIVLMALRKEPERRYSSVEQLAEDIRRYLEGLPVRAHKDTLAYRGAKFVRRNKAGVVAAALVFAVLLAGIIVTATQRNRAEQQRARAEKEEFRNRQLLYASQMNLAYQAWETNNVGRALDLLEAQRPAPGREDFRGFEWHLLWRLTHERSKVLGRSSTWATSVAFSPDGTKLAATDLDGKLRLWELSTGRPLSSWDANPYKVDQIIFSPDGDYLVGSFADGLVRLWQMETGQLVKTLEGHAGAISQSVFAPDGRTLATASADQTVKLWNLETGQEVATLRGHRKAPATVAFSPDGKMLATGSHDSDVKLWDVTSGNEVATLKGHSWIVFSVEFSPDGKLLATAGSDSHVKLWDVASRREVGTIQGDGLTIRTLRFAPDGRTLAVGTHSKVAKIYEVATLKLSDLLRGHTDTIISIAFSPDSKFLASGGEDGTVRLWDLTKQSGALTLDGHTDWVWSLAFSPDGRTLATSSKDATVKLWEAVGGRELRTITHPEWVNGVAFSPDGVKLGTASDDTLVRLWDAATGQNIFTLTGHASVAECVAFSPDGRLLASGAKGGDVKLWDVAAGREVATLRALNPNIVWSLAFSPDGKYLASGEGGKRDQAPTGSEVTLWDVTSGQILTTLTGHTMDVRAVAFSPDGKLLASGSEDGTIKLWDVSTLREMETLKGGKTSSLAFSPDGRRLVSGGYDKAVKLWDVATRQELCTLTVPSEITFVGFSPDNNVLAAATKDNKVRLWSAATED